MKEVTIQDFRRIEDAELRWLTRYEHLINWGKSGTLRVAAQAYYDQIEQAEQKKALAQLRIAQIDILQTAVSRFDGRAIRNAQMAAVAAKHRADVAERQAIQAACDEIMALEEIVPADEIDDILSTVSAALGIELPTDADRPDICQRGHKSIQDLKRELGPSLANPVQQVQAAAEVLKAEELIADVRRASILQGMEAAPVNDRYFEVAQDRQKAETALLDFVKGLAAKAHGLTDEPVIMPTDFRTVGAWFRPVGTEEWLPSPPNNESTAIDTDLNDDALDAAYNVVHHPFDAGKTLEQLGWSPPSDEPPDPYGVTPIAEIIRRAAA
ncbi:hypothetical protein [Allorhizobium undicola]|uniref:hypothetical protein n=1 Tax=Allorhizobium undicola TaxID=78527 RepID=UPI000484C7EF|nr:hypothetical protein [Allorhizobium undicola]